MSNSVQLRHFLIVLSGFAVICLLCTFAYRIAVKHEAVRNTSLPSGVCDIPFNLPLGHFNVSEETPINCSTGESVKSPPLVMRYNEATREDELCKVPGNEHLQCEYSTVHYQGDNTNTYGSQWYPLDEDTILTRAHLTAQKHDGETRYVLGRCTDRASDQQLFEDVFIFMPSLYAFVEVKSKVKDDDNAFWEKPSILVLVIESTSRINFHRSMPMTVAALRDLGPIFYMKGTTRIADNTYPNMVAFTTGRLVEDLPVVQEDTEVLDDLPFIWRLFERRGYPTALLDDNPSITQSMFSYSTDGFLNWPTTFNVQPFWTYWKREEQSSEDENCLKDAPVPAVLLSQLERFIQHCQVHQLPYFALAMLIRTTHDDWRAAAKLDTFYAPFLKRLAPRLNNTILIVMGDHGVRFEDDISPHFQTENNLPLMAIRLPPSLHQRYPLWGDTLLKNKRRLTTNLDVHKTLVEIARLVTPPGANLTGEEVFTDHAYSLVSEVVPLTRTCADARVPDLYCVCRMKKTSVANRTAVQPVIDQFERQLNLLFPRDKCQRLTVHYVESAYVFETADWLDFIARKEMIEFTVLMAPSGALLRTRMSQSSASDWSTITAAHEIDRLDMYGNQSHCITNRVLRKYCLCHDVLGLLANVTTVTEQGNSTDTSRVAKSSVSLTNTTWKSTQQSSLTVANAAY